MVPTGLLSLFHHDSKMNGFPVELMSHVCTFLGRTDLTKLALTSRLWLAPARWQLFTSPVLHSDSPYLADLFHLFKTDPQLSRQVISLTIETKQGWAPYDTAPGTTWVEWTIFRNMGRLRSLRFRRLPCVTNDGDPKHFLILLNRVYKHCPNVIELKFTDMFWPNMPVEWNLQPPKSFEQSVRPPLQRVVYNALANSGSNWAFLVLCVFTPSTTIGHLDLFLGHQASYLPMLRHLSFPALRTLYLRSVHYASSAYVASFLVAHASIRHLYLIDAHPQILVDKIVVTSLPALKTLHGSPAVISRLASRCDSIRYVQALVIDCTHDSGSMEELVAAAGGFPNLRHCSLIQVFSAFTTMEIVRLLAKESTLLTHWTGGCYYCDAHEMMLLAEELSQFPALTRVDMCEWTYPDGPPSGSRFKGIEVLAKKLAIKKLCLYMPHLPTFEISTTYTIDRENGGRIKTTYQCFEDGPHNQERRRIDFSSVHWEDEIVLEDD